MLREKFTVITVRLMITPMLCVEQHFLLEKSSSLCVRGRTDTTGGKM